jgi:hypothetical protein
MPLAENQHVIQALAAQRAREPLANAFARDAAVAAELAARGPLFVGTSGPPPVYRNPPAPAPAAPKEAAKDPRPATFSPAKPTCHAPSADADQAKG